MRQKYSIRYTASAARALAKLSLPLRLRISRAIEALADNPLPLGSRRLRGEESAYRIRVGDYRIIYDVLNEVLVILVLRLGYRKDVYR